MQHDNRVTLMLSAACLGVLIHACPTLSCSFHDPKQLATGLMNHIYPNSLQVRGAVNIARRAGELPEYDRSRLIARGENREYLDRIAYARTMAALHSLGIAIENRSGQDTRPAISLVILETMLWTRYSTEYSNVQQGLHVKGPRRGDIVLVTDEPVVQSIQDGLISIERAVELGVIRVYTGEHEGDELLNRIGSIGEAPLSHPGFSRQFESTARSTKIQ